MSGASGADGRQTRRIENLRAVLAGAQASAKAARAPAPPGAPDEAESGSRSPGSHSRQHPSHRGRNSLLGGLAAALAALAGKLKFLGLLAGVLKLKTLASMVLSVGLYATQWGWAFAAGFVLLIFLHELGHWIVLRQEGIPAGAPVFIPFLGAFIAMRGRPRDALVEAKVAIGGPIAGSFAAWAVLASGLALDLPLLITLGHAGILLNLFNLIPVSPLDGGRIAGAFTRWFWIVGYAVGTVALLLTRSPLLFLVMVVGLFTMWQRWRHPVPGYDAIPRAKRLGIGIAFAALLVALALTLPVGMQLHPAAGV